MGTRSTDRMPSSPTLVSSEPTTAPDSGSQMSTAYLPGGRQLVYAVGEQQRRTLGRNPIPGVVAVLQPRQRHARRRIAQSQHPHRGNKLPDFEIIQFQPVVADVFERHLVRADTSGTRRATSFEPGRAPVPPPACRRR
ncbi:MAG: hypothetical protein U0703_21775 [Anaerolineae bacterium]